MKMNRTDLMHTAQSKGIICPSNATSDSLLACLKRGKGTKRPFSDPERRLRSIMSLWVDDYWAIILAQHKGELDCIACPIGRIAGCFLANRRQLQLERRITLEDPWLLT